MRLPSYSIPNHLCLITYINYMPKLKEKENLRMSRHIPNETRQHAKDKAFNYKFESKGVMKTREVDYSSNFKPE